MENDITITLLSEEEMWGVNGGKQLDVLQKYGTKSAVTDLVILTDGRCEDFWFAKAPDDNSLKGRTGLCYTRSSASAGNVRAVDTDGSMRDFMPFLRFCAVRPVLQSSAIFRQISKNRVKGYNGTEEVEYGEYPQYVPDKNIQNELERNYIKRLLIKTGRNYTFDKTLNSNTRQNFQPVTYEEYEYQGKKYIRFNFHADIFSPKSKLSNGESYINGDKVWVEVSPVVWLIDDKTETLISKRGLLSGIRFHNPDKGYNGDFSTTDIKMYLDEFMIKDLLQSTEFNYKNNANKEWQTDEFYQNAYDELTNFEKDNNINEEELNSKCNSTQNSNKDTSTKRKKLYKIFSKNKNDESVDLTYDELTNFEKDNNINEEELNSKYNSTQNSNKDTSTKRKKLNKSTKNKNDESVDLVYEDGKKYLEEVNKQKNEELERLMAKYDSLDNTSIVKEDNKEYKKKILEKFEEIHEKIDEINESLSDNENIINLDKKYNNEDLQKLLKDLKKINEVMDEIKLEEEEKRSLK